jgi:hypothetical protein
MVVYTYKFVLNKLASESNLGGTSNFNMEERLEEKLEEKFDNLKSEIFYQSANNSLEVKLLEQ